MRKRQIEEAFENDTLNNEEPNIKMQAVYQKQQQSKDL